MTSGNDIPFWLILVWVVVIWPILFIGLWIAIVYLMSFIGGWRRLGHRYAVSAIPDGLRTIPHVTGMVGMTRYKRVLSVSIAEEGFYLHVRRIFRFGHPPLYIRWSEIVGARKVTLFYWEYAAFDVGTPRIASLRLPVQVFEGTPIPIAKR